MKFRNRITQMIAGNRSTTICHQFFKMEVNKILVEDSYGVAFTGMEFGRGTTGCGATIRINRGGAVIFTGCMFMNDVLYAPDIVVTDNNNVRFTGCYGSHSGNAITAS